MSGIGTGYDLSSTTYSPDGKVFQTEYAQKAVDNSSTVIGIKCKDGVVLAVEKLIISKLLVAGSNRRIHNVDRHTGLAIAGLLPDGRQLVNRAADECSNYKQFYGEPIPGHVLCERMGSFTHLFNLYWSLRPFGAAAMMACYDKNGPQLYLIDPSGTAHRYFGAAVGKGRQAAKNEIEKLKLGECQALCLDHGRHRFGLLFYRMRQAVTICTQSRVLPLLHSAFLMCYQDILMHLKGHPPQLYFFVFLRWVS